MPSPSSPSTPNSSKPELTPSWVTATEIVDFFRKLDIPDGSIGDQQQGNYEQVLTLDTGWTILAVWHQGQQNDLTSLYILPSATGEQEPEQNSPFAPIQQLVCKVGPHTTRLLSSEQSLHELEAISQRLRATDCFFFHQDTLYRIATMLGQGAFKTSFALQNPQDDNVAVIQFVNQSFLPPTARRQTTLSPQRFHRTLQVAQDYYGKDKAFAIDYRQFRILLMPYLGSKSLHRLNTAGSISINKLLEQHPKADAALKEKLAQIYEELTHRKLLQLPAEEEPHIQSLQEAARNCLHPVKTRIKFAQKALQALKAFHQTTGCVHRDVKGANLILNENTDDISLIDFDIASDPQQPKDCIHTAQSLAESRRPSPAPTPRAEISSPLASSLLKASGHATTFVNNEAIPTESPGATINGANHRFTVIEVAIGDTNGTPSYQSSSAKVGVVSASNDLYSFLRLCQLDLGLVSQANLQETKTETGVETQPNGSQGQSTPSHKRQPSPPLDDDVSSADAPETDPSEAGFISEALFMKMLEPCLDGVLDYLLISIYLELELSLINLFETPSQESFSPQQQEVQPEPNLDHLDEVIEAYRQGNISGALAIITAAQRALEQSIGPGQASTLMCAQLAPLLMRLQERFYCAYYHKAQLLIETPPTDFKAETPFQLRIVSAFIQQGNIQGAIGQLRRVEQESLKKGEITEEVKDWSQLLFAVLNELAKLPPCQLPHQATPRPSNSTTEGTDSIILLKPPSPENLPSRQQGQTIYESVRRLPQRPTTAPTAPLQSAMSPQPPPGPPPTSLPHRPGCAFFNRTGTGTSNFPEPKIP